MLKTIEQCRCCIDGWTDEGQGQLSLSHDDTSTRIIIARIGRSSLNMLVTNWTSRLNMLVTNWYW